MRRYAILDDNQRVLEGRLAELIRTLPALVAARVAAACVVGSVAEGRARDASDVDVVLVLREGEPRRSDYDWWDDAVLPFLAPARRFPVQPVFIARESLATTEPNLRRALASCIPLWDPEGVFDDESEARA
ncbi:MAG: nucleotidyltransferase domain-containing protein [Deltaproteobacteria bacterium]|nr:nucleotidyltransferase domain-containing protein [Deltaproteobacteria bacterium]